MYMDTGMDTGDVILTEEVEIGEEETTGELWERLTKIGGELLVKTLQQVEKGVAPREKQGEEFTIAPMLSKEMARIDWGSKTAHSRRSSYGGSYRRYKFLFRYYFATDVNRYTAADILLHQYFRMAFL